MGCGCNKGNKVTGALGYKVVGSDGRCELTVDEACRVFPSARQAASAARAAGVSNWTVVPVRGM